MIERDVAERLLLLAARQHADRERAAREPLLQPRHPERPHHLVGHDQQPAGVRLRGEQFLRAQQSRPDQDRVGALAELQLEALHAQVSFSARAMSPATATGARPSVRIVIAAIER